MPRPETQWDIVSQGEKIGRLPTTALSFIRCVCSFKIKYQATDIDDHDCGQRTRFYKCPKCGRWYLAREIISEKKRLRWYS